MKIFLPCGIGDFWAMMSFVSDREKQGVKEIYWATRARGGIQPFVNLFFPNLEQQIVLCDDFTKSDEINADPQNAELINRFCVHSIDDLFNRFQVKVYPTDRHLIQDWSTSKFATKAVNGQMKYAGLKEITERKFANIDHLCLPSKFYFVTPWSDNQRYPERDLTVKECEAVIRFLENRKTPGVVFNASKDLWPVKSDWIIDLTNKTNMLESVEGIKAACGYLGTSFAFSVIAPKLFLGEDVHIKGPDGLVTHWYKFYYEPYKNNSSIHRSLEFLK